MDNTKTNSIFRQEPAVIVSSMTAFLAAILGFGAAFGLDLDDNQRNAVIGVVAPSVALIALIGPVIRQFVYSPNTTDKLVNSATRKEAAGETPPVTPL